VSAWRIAARRGPVAVVLSHDVKQPISFPRRIFASGVCNFASPTPNRGVGGAPRNVRVLGEAPVRHAITRHARRLARRLASHDAGRSPLGAPPWRFFTRAASVSGRTRIRRASSSQPGRSAWRAASRASRGERLRAACRGTPRIAPHSGSSLEHALNERGCEPSSTAT
jgi:hypothetical protein